MLPGSLLTWFRGPWNVSRTNQDDAPKILLPIVENLRTHLKIIGDPHHIDSIELKNYGRKEIRKSLAREPSYLAIEQQFEYKHHLHEMDLRYMSQIQSDRFSLDHP